MHDMHVCVGLVVFADRVRFYKNRTDAMCSTAVGAKIQNLQGCVNDVSLTPKKIMNVQTCLPQLSSKT